ncbi:MAG TPA: amino acid ABC transporter substrate-binding protein [Stellaceae bacterium]|nr:amino acid ABC transporter substrate-binding protein [Stellaceae bacterium]
MIARTVLGEMMWDEAYCWMRAALLACLISLATSLSSFPSFAAESIKIGFGMALTGGLAGNGKAALIAMQIWADETNAKGGLLGRPVQLIYYDDQTNPSTVPGIYTKLLDIDKVDLVISGYGTNLQAPAMPIIMQHGMTFIGLFGLAVNDQFHYDRFFQIQPNGPNAKLSLAQGFFEAAMTAKPTPKTVAIVGADAEYPKVATEGARELAKKFGLTIVYDRSYPPATVDFAPVVRAIQAANPDVVFLASYPPDSAGMIRAVNEVGLKTTVFGGGLIGLQFAALKQQLGPLLNGIICYDLYVPSPTMNSPARRNSSRNISPRRSPPAPTRWASISLLSPIRRCRSSGRPSRRRKGSIKRRSPSTSTRRASRPRSATSNSGPAANGRSRACSSCSIAASPATISSSSRNPARRSSFIPPSTSRATCRRLTPTSSADDAGRRDEVWTWDLLSISC